MLSHTPRAVANNLVERATSRGSDAPLPKLDTSLDALVPDSAQICQTAYMHRKIDNWLDSLLLHDALCSWHLNLPPVFSDQI